MLALAPDIDCGVSWRSPPLVLRVRARRHGGRCLCARELAVARHRLAHSRAVTDPPTTRQPPLGGGCGVVRDQRRIRRRATCILASCSPSPVIALPAAMPCQIHQRRASLRSVVEVEPPCQPPRAGSTADPAVAPHPRLPLAFAHHRLGRGRAVLDPPTPRQPPLGGGGSDAAPACPCKISGGSALPPPPRLPHAIARRRHACSLAVPCWIRRCHARRRSVMEVEPARLPSRRCRAVGRLSHVRKNRICMLLVTGCGTTHVYIYATSCEHQVKT